MQQYVLGFAMNFKFTEVVLIQKSTKGTKLEWMHGMFNDVGVGINE